MPLAPGYRNKLRGLPPEELKRRLQQLRGATVPDISDPIAERQMEILQRRKALSENPGARKDIGSLNQELATGERTPTDALTKRAALLKMQLDSSLGLGRRKGGGTSRTQATRSATQTAPDGSLQVSPDYAATSPPALSPIAGPQTGTTVSTGKRKQNVQVGPEASVSIDRDPLREEIRRRKRKRGGPSAGRPPAGGIGVSF